MKQTMLDRIAENARVQFIGSVPSRHWHRGPRKPICRELHGGPHAAGQ